MRSYQPRLPLEVEICKTNPLNSLRICSVAALLPRFCSASSCPEGDLPKHPAGRH